MGPADSDDSTPPQTEGSAHTEFMKALPSRYRRALLVFLVGVFLIGLTLAGEARRCEPAPDEEEPRRTLRVRVVEEDHPDRGVPNALVNVWRLTRVNVRPGALEPGGIARPRPSSNGDATTDGAGRATIQLIMSDYRGRPSRGGPFIRWSDDASLYVQVIASGFTMARRTIAAADWAETEVEVALARGAIVTGKVRKADGTAAGGVRVRGTQPEQGGWFHDSHETVTDSLGAFRLSGISPGWVSLRATLHAGDAVWVGEATAEAGSVDAEIRLPAEPTRRRIRIRVKGADGLRVASARWDAEDGLTGTRASSHGQVKEGEFILPADPDVQWVTIKRPRYKDRKAFPWAPTVVGPLGSRGGDLEVVMPRGLTVSGTVRDEQGKALPGVLVFARPLITEGGTERHILDAWSDSVSDAEGRFRIEGVPPGRIEIDPGKGGWSADLTRVSAPTDPLNLVMRPMRRLRATVRHEDGTPAPEAVLCALGWYAEAEGWTGVSGGRDGKGNFSMSSFGSSGVIRLRAGLSPSWAQDMAASEVTVGPEVDPEAIVLTVPRSRSLLVHIPDWPVSVLGAARLANGPYSPGFSVWIVGGAARFDGIDPRAPLSFYCGPLPDGRIAFSRDLSAAGAEVTVPLVPSRSIRGRARGFPADAQPYSVWADTSAFEAPGRVGPDGSFLVRGVPPGACRVCVVFKRGKEVWAGSVRSTGSADPVKVEVRRMDVTALDAWVFPRPPP